MENESFKLRFIDFQGEEKTLNEGFLTVASCKSFLTKLFIKSF